MHTGVYDVTCKQRTGTSLWAVAAPVIGAVAFILILAGIAFRYRKEISREWWVMKVNRIKRRSVMHDLARHLPGFQFFMGCLWPAGHSKSGQ